MSTTVQLYTDHQRNLLELLRENGVALSAPCGGLGTCGKCVVRLDGKEVLACQTVVVGRSVVEVPETEETVVLTRGISLGDVPAIDPVASGDLLAVDIGTTTVAAFLLDGKTGEQLGTASLLNPQTSFGADVISRIQAAMAGSLKELQGLITESVDALVRRLCEDSGRSPADIGVVSLVGNPAMQQLFLGVDPKNLASVPFDPVLTETKTVPAVNYLPSCDNAQLLVVPDVAGYVGADTVGAVLATKLDSAEDNVLLVDIGTNGEMVLRANGRMAACSTAAGPALEGAKITFGMRGAPGAIDKVWLESGQVRFHVIGGTEPTGLCGSGLIDAVAAFLDLGLINKRGRIQNREEVDGERVLRLTDDLYLTQTDIHEVMLAKGAIAAGVELLSKTLDIEVSDIDRVLLAGAFGSFLDADNACRIGLLPGGLSGKTTAVGNAAGVGACRMALSRSEFERTDALLEQIAFVELANLDDFMSCFARHMGFTNYLSIAEDCGFDHAAALDVSTLKVETWVRDTCAEDKCHAYGHNWTCPPACGTLEECEAEMQKYRHGILLQVTGTQEKRIDVQCYAETEARLREALLAFAERIREDYPDCLVLGAGACRICPQCAYPEPCRFPDKAMSSMEAYGLFVTRVCKDNGVPYYYGPKTITYTACVLY